MLNLGFKDKSFYNKMIAISIPIMLQNLISSVLNMVDTVMVGALGEAQLAAVGLANQVFFVFFLLIYGINSGCGIFIAQYWGSKDEANIKRTIGFSVVVGAVVGLIFTLVAFYLPGQIMQLFTTDRTVIKYGIDYMRFVSLGYVLTSISIAYSFAARNIGDVKAPTIISMVSLIFNGVFNFVLIFGYLGFPRLEVQGAAIATVSARLIEALALVYWVYAVRKNKVLAPGIKDMKRLSMTYIKNIMVTAIPVILNDVFWALGMTMYSAAYARIGTTAIAAIQIANTAQNIFIVISIGLASSCAVMLGNEIGSGEKEKAILYAKRFLAIGTMAGLLLGVLLILISPVVLMLFSNTQAVQQIAQKIMLIMGAFLWCRFLNGILVVGVLRSGGDTTFAMILETCSVWLVGVPLAFAGALLWHFPVYFVYTLITLEELVKAFFGIGRVRSNKWVRDVR
ncbi:MAG: family efflux transporter [Clostridia bacterium]|jgi:putative MATE family efflux protein|nr:family efflux transporter [Clostridia bacterium]